MSAQVETILSLVPLNVTCGAASHHSSRIVARSAANLKGRERRASFRS